ncbi:MAG: MCE family protein [Actinophytocola sp.]|nr:MCE family protein [Actinophytocola sp.]
MRFTRIRVLATALCVVLAATAAATGFAISNNGAPGTMTIVAQFDSAAPLVDGNEVKLDGVVVGEVVEMSIRDGHANVLLSLEPVAQPVHRDARFTIRPVSLLGERYVDFERGSPTAPPLDPDQPVPVSQTGSNVDLDEMLNVLDEPTGEGLAFLVTTLGEGLRGNGKNADAAMKALAPALRDTQRFTTVLNEQNSLLNALVEQVQPVAKAVATEDGKALDRLVGAADRLLAATSSQQRALDTTLARLPDALRTARKTLDQLAGTAKQATPTLREMRPVTEELTAISGELMRFSDALDPALATADPVLRRAEKLLDAAAPVSEDLRAAGPGLRKSLRAARPTMAELTANRDKVFDFIRYWALATNGRDGLSHYLRVNAIVNPDTLTGALPGGTPKQAAEDKDSQDTPQLPGVPGVSGLLPSPESDDGDKKRDPTGLTPEQESGLMGFLIGDGS